MDDNVIEVHGLTKSYGDNKVLHGIDLTVRRGEILAVLGPNGAGKTTTVEILSAHRPRDGGRVEVLGVDPAKADRRFRSRIGIVTQSANDLLELTVTEAVTHFARYYPKPRDPSEVIDAVGLSAKAEHRIAKLSGGQRRRLDVAVGVVGDPELLFCDEPTTGFDPEARQRFWQMMRTLKAGGTTIALTTHYLEEAQALADRVTVIADGRVAASGTPESLVDHDRVTVTWDGGRRVTATPTRLIGELADHHLGEIPGLTVTRESLEDVYLRLTDQEPKP